MVNTVKDPPVSHIKIRNPWSGQAYFENNLVGIHDNVYYRVFIEGKTRDPIKLYFKSEREYQKWKSIRGSHP